MGEGMEIYKTVCMLCFQVCGIDAYVRDGKLVKVEGMKEHPFSRGVLCHRGYRLPEYVYAPDRLKYPLRRNSAGGFDRISWSEALDEIATRLQAIKAEHGARAVGLSIGSKGAEDFQISAFAQRWRGAFGTPNFFSIEAHCFRSRIMARQMTFGMYPLSDPDNTECIILWGHNPDATEPPLATRINKLLDRGLGLVVIDPKRIPLARKGLYLQIKPGTDAALALAMIHVIIRERLYDMDFIDHYTTGFENLSAHVASCTPEWAAEICEVAAEDICHISRIFACAKSACIEAGICSLDQHINGFQTNRAMAILQAITGNINKPGGWCQNPFMRMPDLRLVDGYKGQVPIGCKNYPIFHGFWGMTSPYGRQMDLPEAILNENPYPVRAMLVHGSNMVAAWPDSDLFTQAMAKLDLLVVMDLFMTQTAKLAHFVLPASANPERLGVAMNYGLTGGMPYCLLNRRIIDPPGECWPDWKYFAELGRRMGYDEYFPWQTDEEMVDFLLQPSGITRRQLEEEHPSGMWFGERAHSMTGKIRTPSGKIELYSATLQDAGYEPLPTYVASPQDSSVCPDLTRNYPLTAVTGMRSPYYVGWQFKSIQELRRMEPDPRVEVHPQDAASLGITDGEEVYVETPDKSIRLKAFLTEDIKPGVIGIAHGWEGTHNGNVLAKNQPNDPVTGYPALMRNFACRIKKI
ncbi:MAG: molybdopterin-dependent oxidoreductase [Syntrophales bacterium]|jgi:anaerobic selenocysteine-containing dehydrogenase|nr:molybdopterin-dependent oxidoreductase [Syntrophales bacterium]